MFIQYFTLYSDELIKGAVHKVANRSPVDRKTLQVRFEHV